MPERPVQFTEQFFNRLDWLLPGRRRADGTPSVTDRRIRRRCGEGDAVEAFWITIDRSVYDVEQRSARAEDLAIPRAFPRPLHLQLAAVH